MMADREKAAQLSRITRLIHQADEMVWSRPTYPAGHRPNIEVILPKIQIGTFATEPYKIHPLIKPELRQEGEAIQQQLMTEDSIKQAAWYDESTGRIFIGEANLADPDSVLRGIIYHECAFSVSAGLVVLSSPQYSPSQHLLVRQHLTAFFAPHNRPKLAETTIHKSGYREEAMIGQYSIGSLYPASIDLVHAIYPTIVELVTDQIVQRAGNFSTFDKDIRTGLVSVATSYDHPRFARRLFFLMGRIDWRELLAAFKTGDLERTVNHIANSARVKRPNALNVLNDLCGAMQEDEACINMINSGLIVNPAARLS